ncbi:MAG: SDR family NAD(P)-dependent oxidoreductase [Cyanobacteria bacterium SZAS LIN-5]|nr:SDR family NAD(P)-dependent oxidoreductase [Cyanobacteria bacterium SZAS LIN-5]
MTKDLKGKVAVITGASRGIGLAIAEDLARQGVKIVALGKTVQEPTGFWAGVSRRYRKAIKMLRHPLITIAMWGKTGGGKKLEGSIDETVARIEALGGEAMAFRCDVRDEKQVEQAVAAAVERFGRIDFLINNASALAPLPIDQITPKQVRLITEVNYFGTLWACKFALPHLVKSGGRILTMSPPLNLDPYWFRDHLPYTISKYNMSMITLGLAKTFKGLVGVNCLWPATAIDTAAIRMLEQMLDKPMVKGSRTTEIVAQAAVWILSQAVEYSGNFVTDEEVMHLAGVHDLEKFASVPGEELVPDYFLGTPSREVKPPFGYSYHEEQLGLGAKARSGQIAVVHCTMRKHDGSIIESSHRLGRTSEVEIGSAGVNGMRVGGKRVFTISPSPGLGIETPIFVEVELIEVKPGKPN